MHSQSKTSVSFITFSIIYSFAFYLVHFTSLLELHESYVCTQSHKIYNICQPRSTHKEQLSEHVSEGLYLNQPNRNTSKIQHVALQLLYQLFVSKTELIRVLRWYIQYVTEAYILHVLHNLNSKLNNLRSKTTKLSSQNI